MQDGKLHKSGFQDLYNLPIDCDQKMWYNRILRKLGALRPETRRRIKSSAAVHSATFPKSLY